VPVAVTVKDVQQGKPRMVVGGCAVLVANVALRNPDSIYFSFMDNCLQYLVERPGNLGIAPKKSTTFTVDNTSLNFNRMIWTPLWLVTVAIVGLGMGVWIVRRR
jgi:hypothetical protein